MDRTTRNIFAAALIGLLIVAAGAVYLLGGTSGPPPGTTSVDGVIVGVQSDGLTQVRSFDLRATGGEQLQFGLGALENGVEFPPGHLAEHQLTAVPVRVWYRTGSDGGLLAVRLEDAP